MATTVDLDLSEFESQTASGTACKVTRLLAELPDEDREKFSAAIDAAHISTLSIVKVFRSRGLKVDDSTVARHRKGACCCE